MSQLNRPERQGSEFDDEFDLIDILIVLAKHKALIITLPLIAAVVAGAVSFTLPNVYKASTTLLPPQQAQSGTAALLSQLNGVAGLAAGAAGLKSPNDLYIGMLKSRVIADKLIEKFALKNVYDTDSLEEARLTLEENTAISSGKDGLITISVEGYDKNLVPRIANGYAAELLDFTRELAVTESAQRRMFFEQQLELSKNKLAVAEVTLKRNLETQGVISVDSDSLAIVETLGRLRARISANEVRLSSMRAFVTTTNPDYRRVEEELISLRAELWKLENGRPAKNGRPPQRAQNSVGLENIKILRDVKYHQMLYELLAKQYEAARLEEAKDPSIIQILDPAITPERKFKPKRVVILTLSAVLALITALVWSFIAEAKHRALRLPGGTLRWTELKSYLRR